MLNLIEFDQFPILQQLQLEEALLRTSSENWCLINRGSPPAIVMGISQDPVLVVNFNAHQKLPIPLIRRYSGGGTVVIEPTTVLVTLILNHESIHSPPFPKEVLRWTEALYKPAFNSLFALQENDYAIENKKCGGNAQYFAKKRLVHHTSFVWDYSQEHMNLLHMPPKMPEYRQKRSHSDFLEPLKSHFKSPLEFSQSIVEALSRQFLLKTSSEEAAFSHLALTHRKSVEELDLFRNYNPVPVPLPDPWQPGTGTGTGL